MAGKESAQQSQQIGIYISGDAKAINAIGELIMKILMCESAEQETKRAALAILPETVPLNTTISGNTFNGKESGK